MRFYNVLKIARPDSICWESRVFCLCWKGMSRLPGLRVRDSKAFKDSAPGFNFAVEQGILFGSQGDH